MDNNQIQKHPQQGRILPDLPMLQVDKASQTPGLHLPAHRMQVLDQSKYKPCVTCM
jgi:hypothetical protein